MAHREALEETSPSASLPGYRSPASSSHMYLRVYQWTEDKLTAPINAKLIHCRRKRLAVGSGTAHCAAGLLCFWSSVAMQPSRHDSRRSSHCIRRRHGRAVELGVVTFICSARGAPAPL